MVAATGGRFLPSTSVCREAVEEVEQLEQL